MNRLGRHWMFSTQSNMICIRFKKDHSAAWVENGVRVGEGWKCGPRQEGGWRLEAVLVKDGGGSD